MLLCEVDPERTEHWQTISLSEWRIRLCKSHSTQVRIFWHTTHQTPSSRLERADAFFLSESFSLAADNKMFRLIMKRVRSKRDRVRAGLAYSRRTEKDGGRRNRSLIGAGSKCNLSKSKRRSPGDWCWWLRLQGKPQYHHYRNGKEM